MTETLMRNFTHITIPAEIWLRRDLSTNAKALWAELRSLHSREKGGCHASDEYLMEFLGLKRSRLHELFKELKDKGLMEVVSFNGRQTIRRAIVPDVEYVSGQQLSGKPDTSNPENRTPPIRKTGFSPYIDNKEENKEEKNIAQSTQTATPFRAKETPISFSFEKRIFENLTDPDLKAWKELYPELDIVRELKRMIEWILANPSKAKSKKLWRKFIITWLQNENEKLTNRSAFRKSKEQEVLSRHTGLNQDNRPRNPKKIIDLREET